MRSEEMSDPHDDLLLTERPTTIVTQHTMANDSMPSPYGSSEDEEALFSEVGNDNGLAANEAAINRNAASTQGRMPAVAREGDVIVVEEAAPSNTKQMLAVVAIGLGLGWLLSRGR
jgi:hypothetical protein